MKSIDLSYSRHLIRLPDFSKASNLGHINLNGCCSLVDIHESILSLHELVYLSMEHCKNVKSLKSDVHLKSLKTLILHCCYGLEEFSIISREMDFIDLSYTAIDELPQSIKFLKKLTRLCLLNCENLKHLPNELFELRFLWALNVSKCKNLNPSNLCILFDGLGSLKYLQLENCHNLCGLPDNISNLSLLNDLTLNGSNVKIIPPNFKYLSKLRTIRLSNYKRLQHITNVPPSINSFYASKCKKLQSIAVVLPLIEHLNVSGCKKLRSILLISPSIEEICISNDGRLQTILVLPPSSKFISELSDNINLLSKSHDLSLSGSNARIMSASFKHLLHLKSLNLSNC